MKNSLTHSGISPDQQGFEVLPDFLLMTLTWIDYCQFQSIRRPSATLWYAAQLWRTIDYLWKLLSGNVLLVCICSIFYLVQHFIGLSWCLVSIVSASFVNFKSIGHDAIPYYCNKVFICIIAILTVKIMRIKKWPSERNPLQVNL